MNDKLRFTSQIYSLDKNKYYDYFSNGFYDTNKDIITLDKKDYLEREYQNNKKIVFNNDLIGVGILSNKGAKVEINPNKIMNIDYGKKLEYNQLKESVEIAQSILDDIGVIADLKKDFQIYSYHSSFDILADYENYKDVLFRSAILPNKNWEKLIRENSIYCQTKQYNSNGNKNKGNVVAVNSYNKSKKYNDDLNILLKKELIAQSDYETSKLTKQILRNEYRADNIITKERLSFKNVSESIYENIRESNKEFIYDTFFGVLNNPVELKNSILYILEVIRSYKKIPDVLVHFANQYFIDKGIDINEIVVSSNDKSFYQKVSRFKKLFKHRNNLDYSLLEKLKELELLFKGVN